MLDGSSATYDYAIVGGGLSGALIALSLLARRPRVRLALIEREAALGGNHVWCFHEGDVSAHTLPVVAPLVVREWGSYDVEFDGFERRIERSYAAVSSQRLDQVVRAAFSEHAPSATLLLGCAVTSSTARRVVLEDGRALTAEVVIAAAGPNAAEFSRPPAFQKFVGLELSLSRPSPRSTPLLMDARVPQRDGFRFFYVLPFAPDRVLIEDTYFSASPALDWPPLERGILEYAERGGYAVGAVLRRESGVLPLPLDEPLPRDRSEPGPLIAGYGGGFFHPTTGYSFPLAVRVAELVASTEPSELASRAWPELLAEHRRRFRFCVLLNRLLYTAFTPEDRHHVIQRFYRLPLPLLERFYAMTLTRGDQLRVFCDKPPRGFSLRLALSGGHPR